MSTLTPIIAQSRSSVFGKSSDRRSDDGCVRGSGRCRFVTCTEGAGHDHLPGAGLWQSARLERVVQFDVLTSWKSLRITLKMGWKNLDRGDLSVRFHRDLALRKKGYEAAAPGVRSHDRVPGAAVMSFHLILRLHGEGNGLEYATYEKSYCAKNNEILNSVEPSLYRRSSR